MDNTAFETTAAQATDTADAQPAENVEANRVRVSYTPDTETMTLSVRYGQEKMDLPAGEELFAEHPEVKDHLALVGLTTYLQRESSRAKDEEKLVAADKGYEKLLNEGIKAFERKPGGGPRGPRKADKIAALAALKGATTAAIEAKLSTLSKEEQDKILNHPKVLKKLEKMTGTSDELDLGL